MKRSSSISLLLLLLLAVSAHAQLAWHKGEVMPATGIRLWGELCYQPRTNALLFRQAKEADTWRTYPTNQLHHFNYVTPTGVHCFATYDVPLSTGENRALLFQELIPGASVALLQLADTDGSYGKANRDCRETPKQRGKPRNSDTSGSTGDWHPMCLWKPNSTVCWPPRPLGATVGQTVSPAHRSQNTRPVAGLL